MQPYLSPPTSSAAPIIRSASGAGGQLGELRAPAEPRTSRPDGTDRPAAQGRDRREWRGQDGGNWVTGAAAEAHRRYIVQMCVLEPRSGALGREWHLVTALNGRAENAGQ